MSDSLPSLLEVSDLVKVFSASRKGVRTRELHAVDGVSFTLARGEVLALVGESGSGKSTVGRMVAGALRATSGRIVFDGTDITAAGRKVRHSMIGRIQMVFQDPYSSVDPRWRIDRIIAEPLCSTRSSTRSERDARVLELLDLVGLDTELARRRPYQLSGGQRQRVAIARALALNPDLLVCDEPIASLDVSVGAQVVNLLGDLRSRFGLAILFITHDLGMVRYLSDKVAVMYMAKLVEVAPADRLYGNPLHPYSAGLLSAVPVPDPGIERRRAAAVMRGELPDPLSPPPGCRFAPRCPIAIESCSTSEPVLRQIMPDHQVACALVEPGTASGGLGGAPGPQVMTTLGHKASEEVTR